MSTYKVTYRQITTTDVIVDADSAEEAAVKVLTDSDLEAWETNLTDWEDPQIERVVEVEMEFVTPKKAGERYVEWREVGQ